MSGSKHTPVRSDFKHFTEISTRWSDNDAYSHVNNVVYYSFFDTAVNQQLIELGVLDVQASDVIGLVVETQCRYISSIAFPDKVYVGMRTEKVGNSSVKYELGVFRNDEQNASAVGHFVHVYVDRATNRPVTIPDHVRKVLDSLKS